MNKEVKEYVKSLNFEVKDCDDRIGVEEFKEYIKYIKAKKPRMELHYVKIMLSEDGNDAELTYKFLPYKFERIRRITGYLAGTLDRFNNAKRAEVADRVKHGVGNLNEMEKI